MEHAIRDGHARRGDQGHDLGARRARRPSQLIWILAERGRRLHRAELLTQGNGEFTFDCSTTSYQGQAASYAS